ncbi:MAG: alpha-amylase family glycosyl hydrolase [Chthoniobacterales bacterium]
MTGSDGATIDFSSGADHLRIQYRCGDVLGERSLFIALRIGPEIGSAVLPFCEAAEGSTVFLPFQANQLFLIEWQEHRARVFQRRWENWKWSEREAAPNEVNATIEAGSCTLRLPRALFGAQERICAALFAKDFSHGKTWGWFFGCSDPLVEAGEGDKYISHYLELDLATGALARCGRLGIERGRLRIYQLFVRLFGNINETRRPNGTLAQNGVGKFNDINDAALQAIRRLGFSHIWLTGVLQQASATDYSAVGQPAADADLLKGLAGSPYAIEDYFDVSADYAVDLAQRLAEFRALLDRIHGHEMKALIDFVPNHVARCYHSDIQPEIDFGTTDDRAFFFHPGNNFFHLQPNDEGPPLRLPTWRDGVALSPTCRLSGMDCDGLFGGELEHGRVTGNNVVSWKPSLNDWYETVKLNYGFDFTDPQKNVREYPSARSPGKSVPNTWEKMDRVIAYWQSLGVDGFRCDMAHMEPPEFWKWLIARARERVAEARHPECREAKRNEAGGSGGAAVKSLRETGTETRRDPSTPLRSAPDDGGVGSVVFIAEAYDNDPAKVPGSDPVIARLAHERGNVMFDMLDAGFDGVYDDPTYRALKAIYEGGKWANDIDSLLREPFIFENSLRYAENHDEVRLASPNEWSGLGMEVGRVVSAILFGLSRGPVMLYNGQEVGEPAAGAEGFGGDDARTTIFDYWSMPELVRWVHDHKYDGGQLSAEQKALRAFYGQLVRLSDEPAFRSGTLFSLNAVNRENPHFGRLDDESVSGHWCYAFLRCDPATKQAFLVLANLHPTETLRGLRVIVPAEALRFLDVSDPAKKLCLIDRLAFATFTCETTVEGLATSGLEVSQVPPLTARYLELSA